MTETHRGQANKLLDMTASGLLVVTWVAMAVIVSKLIPKLFGVDRWYALTFLQAVIAGILCFATLTRLMERNPHPKSSKGFALTGAVLLLIAPTLVIFDLEGPLLTQDSVHAVSPIPRCLAWEGDKSVPTQGSTTCGGKGQLPCAVTP